MLGAVVGDVLGSVYEGGKRLSRDCALPAPGSRFTDDSVFTMATAEAMLLNRPVVEAFRAWGERHAAVGASKKFSAWLASAEPRPYQGDTNGALMRVSPAIALAETLEQAHARARAVTEVTHDHPRALAAVAAYTEALWAAMHGQGRNAVCARMVLNDDAGSSLDELHQAAAFRMKADQTLADVRECLRAADSFEAVMRNCLYCGGDVDTLCAVAGTLAEPLWGIPHSYVAVTLTALTDDMIRLLQVQYHLLAARHTRHWAQEHQTSLHLRLPPVAPSRISKTAP